MAIRGIGDLVALVHPRCTCEDHDHREASILVMQTASAAVDQFQINGSLAHICDRQLLMAAVMACYGILKPSGMTDEQMDEEIALALEVTKKHRDEYREIEPLIHAQSPTDTVN